MLLAFLLCSPARVHSRAGRRQDSTGEAAPQLVPTSLARTGTTMYTWRHKALGRCRHDLSPKPEPGRLSPGRAFIPSRLLIPGASRRNQVLHAKALSPACPPQFLLGAPATTLHTAARKIPSNFRLHLEQSCHPLPKSADPAQASSSTLTLTRFPVTQ